MHSTEDTPQLLTPPAPPTPLADPTDRPAIVVVHPGDRVLVAMHTVPARDEAVALIESLRERFGDCVEWTLVANVESITVVRKQDDQR